MTERTVDLAGLADELAARVNRLGQTRIDPEAFHAEKSDVAAKLRQLARQLRCEVRRVPSTTWRPEAPKKPAEDLGGVFGASVKRPRRLL